MPVLILYIEDDEVDVLTMKRVLNAFNNIELEVCSSAAAIQDLSLSDYDLIISDCNLPDADYQKLSQLLPKNKTTFVSGNSMEQIDSLLKPITRDDIELLLTSTQIIDLKYIQDLADGETEFEKEMIQTALDVLPDRLSALKQSISNFKELKKAAHKTKSSFRVCGIDNSYLIKIEELTSSHFESNELVKKLVDAIEDQIIAALNELRSLI